MIATPATPPVENDSELENPKAGAQLVRAWDKVDEVEEDGGNEALYLTGRPKLRHFLRYVKDHAVDPEDEHVLIEEWEAASEVVRTLEKDEAGAADNPPLERLPVDPTNEAILRNFLKDPLVQNSFNTVPTEVTYVELDRLVVYQHHIDLTYCRLLERELGPSPTPEQVFRTALMHDHPLPPVKWSRMRKDKFVFMSPSNDMRYLGPMKLRGSNITGYPHPGNLAGVVGLAVGFGSNFLNVIYAENRLILNNGSHRAYVLRKLGVTHAPCIVQHVSSREKLDVVAGGDISEKADHYLKHPRPAMLKDYFNPKLHKVFEARRLMRQITVRFEVEESYVPAP